MNIISGSALSKEIKTQLSVEVEKAKRKHGRTPKLSIVLVGDQEDSARYVKIKKRACEEVGMEGEIHFLPENISQSQLLELVNSLNQDHAVDGILIQLPLPGHINQEYILEAINYQKDADALHPMNVGKLSDGAAGILPCTPKGIIALLKYGNVEISGKHAVVLGRSNLVGKPVAQLLLRENATVTICHTLTENLPSIVKQADILVLAMGNPGVVTPVMLKKGAVIIDVAMNWIDGQLAGDIYCGKNLTELQKIASAVTPVPGGVGPMTIVSLLENTFEIYKSRQTAN